MPELRTAVTCVATGAYVDFVPRWRRSISTYLPHAKCFVFTDTFSENQIRNSPKLLPWGHLPWPYSTTFRHSALLAYHDLFTTLDILIHMDVDAEFIAHPSLPTSNLFALAHPGYEELDGIHAPFEDREICCAYVPHQNRREYLAGGFQGGRPDSYLSACSDIREWSLKDLGNGVIPVWHDESYWNKYCSGRRDISVIRGREQNANQLNNSPLFVHFFEKDHDFYRFPNQRFRRFRSFARSSALTRLWRRSAPARFCRKMAKFIPQRPKTSGSPR